MRVNFFANEPLEQLKYEQYTAVDIKILNDLYGDVKISNSFLSLSLNADFYYSWWATGSIVPLIIALLRRKPVFVVVGGNEALLTKDSITGQYFGYGAFNIIKKLLVRFVLSKSSRLIAVSDFSKQELKKVTNSHIDVIPNALDLEHFSCLNKHNSISRKTKFITVCRLDCKPVKIKRIDNLIIAFSSVSQNIPDATLSIVGAHGNDYERLVMLSIEHGVQDKVLFLGKVPNTDMPKLLMEHTCYIQLSDVETFGVAVVEAAAMLLPLILSRRGALPEVTDGVAMFIDHNNISEIARALLTFDAGDYPYDLSSRQALRQHIISLYSYEKRKQKLSDLFEETFGVK